MKVSILEAASYEAIVSLLPECIIGMDIVPSWGMFPLSSIVKQKA